MRKAALHNLGCKVNAYETESMRQILEDAGYQIVPFEEKADVYVINTCTVTNIADRKSRQMIRRARKNNPDGVVVAAGCYVQTSQAQAREDGTADILIGNNRKHELADLLEAFFAEKEPEKTGGPGGENEKNIAECRKNEQKDAKWRESAVGDIAAEKEYEQMGILRTGGHTRAFLKVQDGCDQFCSYCVIPYARGRVRSRAADDAVREAEELAAGGYREVVLTGIHLSSYGADFRKREGEQAEGLLELIRKIHAVEGIARIRLGSLEPKIVTEEFAAALAGLPKVCPHFHLSLQSGCDQTLRRMNRKYTCREYEEGCETLRRHFAHPAITTDVIVGFPGETEEEFEQTRAFLRRIGFFEMHIFKYSLRKGTRAAKMEGQVKEEAKNERSAVLFADAAPMNQAYLEWHIGREAEVLVEETIRIDGKEYAIGHTKEYVKVAFPLEEGREMSHKFVRGKVNSFLKEHILLAERISIENMD